ncbi:MAG: hypothetical protein VB120_04315 [Lachnospiraceae bacterium]|nr:hypothetical protein [Lachnospiraceae bacterium]
MGPPGPRGFPGIPGPPGLSGLSAFGGRYNDSEQTIIIPAEGEEVIELPETLPSLNAIYGTDNIIINRPGIYRVEFMVMLGASTGTVGAQIYVRLNGVAIPSSVLEVSLTTSFQNLNLSTFVLLAPGNILDLAISSTAGGTVVFGPSVNANLSVMKISV